jgi:hypothetical protein
VRSDIGETTDLAAKEPQRLKELSAMLVARYEEIQQQAPTWDDLPEPNATKAKGKGNKAK